jgi:hypothetical protein
MGKAFSKYVLCDFTSTFTFDVYVGSKIRCPAECHRRKMFGNILFQILHQRLDILIDIFCAFCLSISYDCTSN